MIKWKVKQMNERERDGKRLGDEGKREQGKGRKTDRERHNGQQMT